MSKTNPGLFFEDYHIGQTLQHAVPRTLSGGERALYHALYPARHAFYSSDEFARDCGLHEAPLDDLIVFHTVFGKTVPDISLNAVANLGYAEARFLKPVFAGDTLQARSEVIGLKENSNGKTGIVWVRTTGINHMDEEVLSYVRWVMVRKRPSNTQSPHPTPSQSPKTVIPELAPQLAVEDLAIPEDLSFENYNFIHSGEPYVLGDYKIGEKIDHIDGVTLEESEHMLATRLWQNTAKVHFDKNMREGGARLIYGGHIMSMARALSFNGLANAQIIVGLNAGTHANPCVASDTVYAYSEVLDTAPTATPGIGAIRLRLVAHKTAGKMPELKLQDGSYAPEILLDLDYWALMPA